MHVLIDFGHRQVNLESTTLRDLADNLRDRKPGARGAVLTALGFKTSSSTRLDAICKLVLDIAEQTPGAWRFDCISCGAPTHGVEGIIGLELCSPCLELAGLDNQLNDDGRRADHDEGMLTIALRDEIIRNGGDDGRAMASCPYIWPEG